MMDVEAALVSDSQPAEFVEPCETSFDDPAMASKFLRGIDAATRDPGGDVPTPACFAAAVMIVGLVGMQLVGPPARLRTGFLPRWPLMASMRSSNGVLSWPLAPVRRKASGMPFRSVAKWRFVPARPRSVGLGPVARPPF